MFKHTILVEVQPHSGKIIGILGAELIGSLNLCIKVAREQVLVIVILVNAGPGGPELCIPIKIETRVARAGGQQGFTPGGCLKQSTIPIEDQVGLIVGMKSIVLEAVGGKDIADDCNVPVEEVDSGGAWIGEGKSQLVFQGVFSNQCDGRRCLVRDLYGTDDCGGLQTVGLLEIIEQTVFPGLFHVDGTGHNDGRGIKCIAIGIGDGGTGVSEFSMGGVDQGVFADQGNGRDGCWIEHIDGAGNGGGVAPGVR